MLELAAIVLFAVAVFAQWRVRDFTATSARTWLTRAILAILGVGVGIVFMRVAQPQGSIAWLLVGFGLVHVPPAIVLVLKGLRGEQPS
jgi:hypothetical protein